ncbi:Glycoside hydrolase family 10 [Macrophomina phaseolina MS6]|uniref:Glycoside hydrolase family 10 n=1 Tax=Macrophomina phaseolina (strain MS6) TaxID=1126212 RepID=K2RU22_MACPH|nr:Glycoside hydrolase family 10 [Macrophomina phaseolina MS6]
MAVSHAMRSDVRTCPTRQNRNVPPPEPEPESNNGHPRRRIAVACARCRKRKIRCSGDPGNNAGCQNCRAAGADISACQFHRVGSYIPGPQNFNYPNRISSAPSMPTSSVYQSTSELTYGPFPKNFLSSRAYQSCYNPVGYGDETSADSYGYQPLPLPGTDIFGGFLGAVQEPARGWCGTNPKQSAPGDMYLEGPSAASYGSLQLPYLSSPPVTRHPTVTTDNMSAFSMNSLQSSLTSPSAPSHPALPSTHEHRHLPIPTSTRMHMNPSTELHLRAQPTSAVSTAHALSYSKASAMWNSEPTVHDNRPSASTAPAANQLLTAPDRKQSAISSLQESILSYIPIPNSGSDVSSNPSSSTVYTPSSLSGATPSSLDDKYPTSGVNTVNMTSSNRDEGLPRNDSNTSLAYYGTGSPSGKRNGGTDQPSQEGALVSGQRYAPLQPQTQHTSSSIEQIRRDSFDHHRSAPSHRTSASSLNDCRY